MSNPALDAILRRMNAVSNNQQQHSSANPSTNNTPAPSPTSTSPHRHAHEPRRQSTIQEPISPIAMSPSSSDFTTASSQSHPTLSTSMQTQPRSKSRYPARARGRSKTATAAGSPVIESPTEATPTDQLLQEMQQHPSRRRNTAPTVDLADEHSTALRRSSPASTTEETENVVRRARSRASRTASVPGQNAEVVESSQHPWRKRSSGEHAFLTGPNEAGHDQEEESVSVGSRTGSHEESREQEKEKHVWGDNASRRASVMTMLAIPSLQDLADDEEEDASKDNTDMADPEEDDLQTRQRQRSERVRKAISNARVATLDASIDLLTIHIWVFLWQLYTFFSDTISKIWWLIRKCGPSLVIILLVILILDLLFFAIRTNACSIPMVGYVPVLNQIECPPTNILLLGVLVCPFTSTDLAWCQNKQQPLRDNPIFHTATETTRYPPVSSNAFNFTPIGQTFQDNNEKLVHLRRQAQWLAPMTSDMVQWDYALLELDMYVQASPIQPGAKGSIREGIIELRYLGQKLSPLLQKYSASVPSFVELQIYKTRSTTDALSTLDQSSWFSAKLPLPSLEYTEAFIARLSPWLPLTPTGLQTLYNVGARLSSSYISITSIFSGKPSIDYSAIPFILDSHVAFLNPHLSSIGLVASDITENLARQLEVLAQVCSIAAGDRGMAHASLAAIRERKQAWLYQLLITLRSWEPVNKEARAEWQIAALEHFQVSSNGARRAVGYMARNITGMKESNARLSEYAGQLAGIAKAVEGDLWGEDGGGQSGEEDGKGGSKNNVSLRQKIRHEDLMTIIQQMSASTDVLAEQHRVLTAGEKGEVVGRKERGGR